MTLKQTAVEFLVSELFELRNPTLNQIEIINKAKDIEKENYNLAIDFANWIDKLTPNRKVSVWSKNGEHKGLFTMDNEQLFEIFKQEIEKL